MKKRIFLVSLLALLIAVAALCALPAKADGAVIYISDLGTGDGSSPDNPLGANADFLAACETGVATSNISQGSALYKATQAIQAGGTIVIVGDTTVALGTTAQSSGTNNAYTYGHTGHITVTSVYGGVDYRSTNGAELVFRSTHQNLRLHMSGPMTFENLDFTMLYSGSLYTYIPCRAFVTVFGEGLNMRTTSDPTLATYDATPVNAKLPRICGGYMWSSFSKKSGRNDLVNLTILSGSYYSVAGLGNFPNGSFTLIGDVNMTFGACEIKGNLYGMYDASPRSNVILNGNINMTFTGTTVSVGNVFVTTGASVSGVATSSATNFCKLNGDANVVVNDGTTFNTTFYVTPTVQAASDGNVNYGQVVGNVDITVNAGTAGVNFVRIDLGAQGFATSHASDPTKGKLTLKFNGDNWHASSTTLNSFYFAGSGSNFVSSGGYRYSVLDFSGMTYNEFWNHVNNSNNTPVYNGFRYVSGYAVVPTVQPDGLGVAQYGASGAAYGVNEVVEPIDVITSISCAAQQYTAGQYFSLVGEDLTFTKQSGTTENKTVGTDIDASVFTYTDPGELAVAMDGNEIAVTYPAEWNPLGTAIVFNVPISVEPAAKTFTSLAVTTNPTRTVYAINDTFAPAGMVVTAFYSDSTSDVVALENLTGLPSLLDLTALGGTLGSKTFVLSYTSLGATQTADLVITVTDKINSVTYADIPTAVLNDDAVDFSGMTATVVYEVAGEVAATSADFTVGSYVNTMYNTELQSKRFKVQVTYTDANGLTKAQDIYVPVVSDLTVVNNTIYISNTGVGDGQSASSPLGFDALYPTDIWADVNKEHNSSAVYLFDGNFDQVPSCIYQGSPLYRAIYALLETGGRIVIVDEATFGPGGNGVAHNYITGNATCNIYLPTWNHEIEIVGKDASSVLSYDARLTNPRWHFSGPVNIHGLTLSIDYTSYSTVRPAMAFGGYNSTLDATNMIKRQFDYANGVVEDTFAEKDIGAETAHDPDIGAGKMWGNYSTQNGNATFALTGGKWRFFDATGNTSVSTSGYVVTGDTTIIMTNVTLTSNFYGSRNPNGSNLFARFAGNVTVVVNEGCTFGGHFMFSKRGFTSPDYTYRLVVNAIPTFGADGSYTHKIFWTTCGSGIDNDGYRNNLIIDFSGMDYDTFYANKDYINTCFWAWDTTVVDEDGAMYGRGTTASTNGFKTVIAPSGIKYVGTSIRVAGTLGIRFKFDLSDSLKANPDFTFGVLVGKASNFVNSPLEIGAAKSVDTVLVRTDDMGVVTEDKYFKKNAAEGTTTYVVVLMAKDGRWTDERRVAEYVVRPYAVVNGNVRYCSFLGIADITGAINYKNVESGLARSIQYVAKLAQSYYASTEYAAAVNALAAD